jgi:hypothetical protein
VDGHGGGLKALEQFPDSDQFFRPGRQLYLAWKKANKATAAVDDSDDGSVGVA